MQGIQEQTDVELNPPLDCLGRKRKDYVPAKDDLLAPAPHEDQGDGKDAYGNPVTNIPWHLLEDEEVNKPANDTKQTEKILVFRDHMLEYPQLNLNVCVLGPPEDTRGFAAWLSRAGCMKADSLYDCDLAVFTGGPDVDPCYYSDTKKHPPCPNIYVDDERDLEDMGNYLICMEEGIPMLGVCRGAQFIAAMNNCRLVQHLDGHNGDHSIFIRDGNKQIDSVSSVHHQSVIPGPNMDVLAYTNVSTHKFLDADTKLEKMKLGLSKYPVDVEAYFIREMCAIGVQGHPEYKGYPAFSKYVLELINDYVLLNEDLEWDGNRRRLKNDYVTESKARREAAAEREILTVKEN